MRLLLRLFLLLALLAPALPGRAQQLPPDTLLYDTFRDNNWSWPVGERGRMTGELAAEGYHIRYNSPALNGSSITSKVLLLNDARDYSLEIRLRLRGRAGLLWGYQSGSSGTPPDGYHILDLEVDRVVPIVVLWRYRTGKWEKVFTEPVPAGFDAAGFHTLRVAREGQHLRFYLDSKLVGQQQPATAWPGPGHDLGLYLENPGAEAWVSQVLFRHHSLIQLAPGIPRYLRRERLATGISTAPSKESHPGISADGRWLYFTRSMGNPATVGETNNDIFVAERGANGQWGEPHPIGSPINSSENDSFAHIAPDGQTLLVYGQYDAAGNWTSSNGVSQTTRKADGTWAVPLLLTEELNIPNNDKYISRFIDASGTVALVAGDTKDNPGNSDLYVSLRQPDGNWRPLQALGATINTAGDEQAPFLAPDGKTLYFSSDTHPGYGSTDVFVSTRLDDSWTKWSPPLNMGPGVNSPRYESYFSLPASGEYAYLASEEPGAASHDTDLYRLLLPKALRPAPTLLVRGRVLDVRTNAPVANAEMRYEQLPAGKEVGRLRLGGSGTYEIVLPAGQQYGFRAEAPGYLAAADNLDLTDTTRYGELTRDLYLLPLTQPVEALAATAVPLRPAAPATVVPGQVRAVTGAAVPAVEEKITLNNVFFVQGRPVLLPNSFPELLRLARTLTENPGLQIRLDGHTDNTGDAKDPRPNQVLSEQRVAAIKAYLVKRGVAADRLSTQGYGGSRPVAPNDSEENKRKNRRVEFVMLNPPMQPGRP